MVSIVPLQHSEKETIIYLKFTLTNAPTTKAKANTVLNLNCQQSPFPEHGDYFMDKIFVGKLVVLTTKKKAREEMTRYLNPQCLQIKFNTFGLSMAQWYIGSFSNVC